MTFDPLKPNSPDGSALIMEVAKRLTETRLEHRDKLGSDLNVPLDLVLEFKRFTAAYERITKKGDPRSTLAERMSVKTIAQWVLNVHQYLRGQPLTVVQWREENAT